MQRLNPRPLLLAQGSFQSSTQDILSRIPTKPLTRSGVSKLTFQEKPLGTPFMTVLKKKGLHRSKKQECHSA